MWNSLQQWLDFPSCEEAGRSLSDCFKVRLSSVGKSLAWLALRVLWLLSSFQDLLYGEIAGLCTDLGWSEPAGNGRKDVGRESSFLVRYVHKSHPYRQEWFPNSGVSRLFQPSSFITEEIWIFSSFFLLLSSKEWQIFTWGLSAVEAVLMKSSIDLNWCSSHELR